MRPFIGSTLFAVACAFADCPAPTSGPRLDLPGSPFKLAVSQDGCTIYATLIRQSDGQTSGLAVVRAGQVVRTIRQQTPLTGLVLTPDGRTLIATNGRGVVLFDAERLEETGRIEQPPDARSVYVNVTRDGKTLFIANEGSHSIAVAELPSRKVLGTIQVGIAPIALTFSKDEKWLYTTSQVAAPDWNWPALCDSENPQKRDTKHPRGAVVVVDVAKARQNPAEAVAARVEAGCNPVRLALSPDSVQAYVTTRKDNAVLAFRTSELHGGGAKPSASIEAGTAPVPVVAFGDVVVVGSSNRFGTSTAESDLRVIDSRKLTVTRKLATGKFPRDMILSPDGKTLYVASFGSSAIESIRVAGLLE